MARAQQAGFYPWAFDTLKAADYDAEVYVPPAVRAGKTGVAAATFVIDFDDDFPTEARNAFLAAAEIWEVHIESPVPIVVEAEWDSLGERTLGSAGPLLVANFSSQAVDDVWYPAALANAIRGQDLFQNNPDIQATFNSEFDDWYFGLDGNPPPGKYDFLTVVLHELGHGLGFTGSFDFDDGDTSNGDECADGTEGMGCWGILPQGGSTRFPFIFDLFTEDAGENLLLNTSVYPNPSHALGDVLQSGSVFFSGELSRTINEDIPVNLYAPTPFEIGSSYSHLDEDTFPTVPGNADPNALMTPFVARQEAIHNPGPITCAIFQDIGWDLGLGCLALLDSSTGLPPIDGTEDFALTEFYPSPARAETKAVVRVKQPQRVTAEVFDVTGRRVGLAFDKHVSGLAEIVVDAVGLAPGVYFVRIAGETFLTSRSFVYVGG